LQSEITRTKELVAPVTSTTLGTANETFNRHPAFHNGKFPLLITISVNGAVRYQMKYSRDDVVSDEKSF
jgi:hypothetical protein